MYKCLNTRIDWIDAALDRVGISGSPVIDHASILIYEAVTKQRKLNLAGDSHGTIFLSRSIRRARNKFLRLNGFNKKLWEERAQESVDIVTFGNGHRHWPKGPNYIMVYIDGDALPKRFGTTRERAMKSKRADMKFLVFEPIFARGNFEAHNMMFTVEYLRTTFAKNGLKNGATAPLKEKLSSGKVKLASPKEVKWPTDLSEYAWYPSSLDKFPIFSSS